MNSHATRPRTTTQPLLVLVAVGSVACVAIGTLGLHLHRESTALDGTRAKLATLAQRTERLRIDAIHAKGLQDGVNELVAAGFVSTQRDPRWPHALRAAGLADVEVEVLHEPSMAAAARDAGAGVIFRESLLRIRMPVLHEVELLRRLDMLHAVPIGIMRAQRCSLQRPASDATDPAQSLLTADCQIGWTDALVDAKETR